MRAVFSASALSSFRGILQLLPSNFSVLNAPITDFGFEIEIQDTSSLQHTYMFSRRSMVSLDAMLSYVVVAFGKSETAISPAYSSADDFFMGNEKRETRNLARLFGMALLIDDVCNRGSGFCSLYEYVLRTDPEPRTLRLLRLLRSI